jgi:nuclear cap-binding protein subunit 1
VDSIIATISSSITSREDSRAIYNSFFLPAEVARGDVTPESDQLDNVLFTLRTAQNNGFAKITWMPEPARRFMRDDDEEARVDVYTIPQVTVPPDAEGESTLSRALEGEGLVGTFMLDGRIGLTDGRVPNPSTPDGWMMQSMILDILSIHEVNRIKCAELLIKLTDFCLLGMFRSKPAPGEEEAEDIAIPGEWILASTLISIILSAMFRLPKSPHHVIYLTSVVRELCLANGAMMAPPVGLAMRNIFSELSNGLDVETSRRTAEWFSVHLSNFAYQWMWKAW